jgi:hypothetical protein
MDAMDTFASFFCHACGAVDRVELLEGETEAEFGHKLVHSFEEYRWRQRPSSDPEEPLQELWCGKCADEFAFSEPEPTPETFQDVRRKKLFH